MQRDGAIARLVAAMREDTRFWHAGFDRAYNNAELHDMAVYLYDTAIRVGRDDAA